MDCTNVTSNNLVFVVFQSVQLNSIVTTVMLLQLIEVKLFFTTLIINNNKLIQCSNFDHISLQCRYIEDSN